MSQRGERLARLDGHTSLGLDHTRGMGMRPERIGEAPGRDARGLDRLLRRHAVRGDVEEHLQHRLLLHIAARRAERHEQPPVPEGHGRSGREAGPLARRDLARMAGHEPAL
jgi:hypothetical protein